jgi:hypothetical protein
MLATFKHGLAKMYNNVWKQNQKVHYYINKNFIKVVKNE